MRIRQLGPADRDSLLAFYLCLDDEVNWFYRPFGDATIEAIEGHLSGVRLGRVIALAVTEETDGEEQILGHAFVSGIGEKRPTFGIGLHQSTIGKGWGRKLMSACMAETDKRGLRLVTLSVMKSNERAIGLYESFGFVTTGETAFRGDSDSWVMERATT
jgi:GNAT superfamily N-acetyltransferase